MLFAGSLAFSSLLPQSLALAQPTGAWASCPLGRWMNGAWVRGGIGMILMVLFWILIVVGVVFLIKLLVSSMGGSKRGLQTVPDALAILNDRYARGEIDRDEFEAKKRDIRG